MFRVILLVLLVTTLVSCIGDGNIHLLEDEIAEAIRSCSIHAKKTKHSKQGSRQRRSEYYNNKYPRIDGNSKQEFNQYDHTRRNISEHTQMNVLNWTDYDYTGYGAGDVGEKLIKTIPRPALGNNNYNKSYSYVGLDRIKRSEHFLGTDDTAQCLSQCVFANLEIVDPKGIPLEAKLWNIIQSSVISQQSRNLLRDQLRACFQELQSESEDNGCSYSNKLDRCLMLRLPDRQLQAVNNQTFSDTKSK